MQRVSIGYMLIPALKFKPKLTRKSDYVIQTVAEYFEIPKEQLLAKKRTKHLVIARDIIFHTLRYDYSMTLTAIGLIFNRDHTCVIHGIQALQNFIYSKDEAVIKSYNDVKKLLA